MSIHVPKLEQGRVYRREEVAEYIGLQTGSSDFNVVVSHFPRNLESWQMDLMARRMDEDVVLQYQVFPMTDFEGQIGELEATFTCHENQCQRVQAIVEVLLEGKPVFPVFLQQNDPRHEWHFQLLVCRAVHTANAARLGLLFSERLV